MAVILINPNSTEAMTGTMLEAARAAAPAGMQIEGWTSHDGPPAIQGAEDGRRAEAPLLDLVRRAAGQGADGIVIGCFDDTALHRAALIAPCPVIGIGQAAFNACALRGWRFGVVTTLPVSVPIIETNIARYGLSGSCARVRASDVPVLDLEDRPEAAAAAIRAEAEAACREDGIDALILGCAGMARIVRDVRRAVPVPVIDTVETAIGCIGWLSSEAARLRT
ncbi:aspartate/glutamate racemase family protein [Jannaschia aquimarina]|uniref:Asp/Glu/Hydantoin racemase n=1 Tax=Jannaschia aquimarina TaxID=935700 RepID=A0A0D1ELV1_9RHOB|nr:aspartate/glutamate racemase family protein [Jannaschia aquimarina]KIT17951.1 Asp/Glu/Hydantoin racemase [Jannaschia aquimarina]SNT08216.1 allantoin racemase [Jannaschia aquimarina]